MAILFCCPGFPPEPWLAGFRKALPEHPISEWTAGAPPAEYGVVWAPPQAFLDEQPQMKALFNIGAGVDALLERSIAPTTQVVRIEDGGMAVQMAEYVTYCVIRHVRELDTYHQEMAGGRWAFRRPRAREDFPVGIMGLGVLGQRVARALVNLEYPVRGWSRSPRAVEGVIGFSGRTGFDAFLAGTRILVCLLPLTSETRDILNRDTLGRLLPGSYVINVARGAHLVDEDLLALLDSGHLAGAALDVFRTEPLPSGHPFWTHPKVTVTPHMSARTLRAETVQQIAEKIRALEQGHPIAGVVDRHRGY